MSWRWVSRMIAAAAGLLAPAVASAAPAPAPLVTGDWIVYADLRLAAADGERSWLDGGFGKARAGGAGGGDLKLKPSLAEAALIWQPHITWSLTGLVSVVAQQGQDHNADLSEAFLTYKPLPLGPVRLSVRTGLFWPPVSLEHGGPEWSVTNTITPSAINSWISEEVKVGGGEASVAVMLGEHRLSAIGSLFWLNDTSGTLLSFRGWALHDELGTAFGKQPLPRLNGFMTGAQAARTKPAMELDGRIGFYAGLTWAPPGPFELRYLHYDNRGDPEAVNTDRQWGWRTRFDSAAAILDLDGDTRLIAQAMKGSTVMGFPRPTERWVYTDYRSAFAMATRRIGRGALSARIEAFGTRNHGSVVLAEDDEDGWAATVAGRLPIGDHLMLLAEGLHIDGRRDARLRDGLAPRQRQNILQLSLRAKIAR